MLQRFLGFALLVFGAVPGAALDRVTLATNWKAEAEHGGFYQAIATGIYRRHGLDVTLRMGGPQVNNPQLLAAGVALGVDLIRPTEGPGTARSRGQRQSRVTPRVCRAESDRHSHH